MSTTPVRGSREAVPIIFAVPGDLHLTELTQINYATASWAIDEINRLLRPDFVQFIGDNAQEAKPEQFELFNGLRSRLDAHSDVMVGDHDVHDDPGATAFQSHVGATYGTRRLPGVRFIRLNTQQAKPLGISREQIAWLRREVEEAESYSEQIVIFQHNYPYQIWENFEGPGIDEWRALVQTHRITAIICGHTHYFQEANDGRNIVVAVRSIGDPEGGAPGYLIGYLHGDDLAFTYRTQEEDGPIVLITHPREALLATGPQHVVCGDDEVRVLIRASSAIDAAAYTIAGGCSHPLTCSPAGLWVAPFSSAQLTKGAHHIRVEVREHSGKTTQVEQEFAVDATGRYNPIPKVRPVVTSTKFC